MTHPTCLVKSKRPITHSKFIGLVRDERNCSISRFRLTTGLVQNVSTQKRTLLDYFHYENNLFQAYRNSDFGKILAHVSISWNFSEWMLWLHTVIRKSKWQYFEVYINTNFHFFLDFFFRQFFDANLPPQMTCQKSIHHIHNYSLLICLVIVFETYTQTP